jgi:hypothetical protein
MTALRSELISRPSTSDVCNEMQLRDGEQTDAPAAAATAAGAPPPAVCAVFSTVTLRRVQLVGGECWLAKDELFPVSTLSPSGWLGMASWDADTMLQ